LVAPQGCKPELDFEARAGAPCEDCDYCDNPPIGSCVCDTCTEYAFDHHSNEVLWCNGISWEREMKCPGSGSVACGEHGGYDIRCFDEWGRPWPFPAPSFEAKAGEPCELCDVCKTSGDDSCVCSRCTELAYDDELDQVLICAASEVWEVHATCPGGARVGCTSDFNGDYWVFCLDAKGRETIVTTPSR
jgi:hypothetical protein